MCISYVACEPIRVSTLIHGRAGQQPINSPGSIEGLKRAAWVTEATDLYNGTMLPSSAELGHTGRQ